MVLELWLAEGHRHRNQHHPISSCGSARI